MFRGLRGELTALLLTIALLPLCVVIAVTYRNAEDSLTEELKRGLRAIAERQSILINNAVQDSMEQARVLASAPVVVSAMEAIRDGGTGALAEDARRGLGSIAGLAIKGQRFDNLLLVNLEGRVAYSGGASKLEGRLLSEYPAEGTQLVTLFERTRTILETELSDYLPDQVVGANAAFIGTPIFSSNRLVGVLILQLGERRLLDGVANYEGLGSSGETVIAVRQGDDAVIVAPLRRDRNAAFNSRVPMSSRERSPIALAADGQRGVGFGIDQLGEEVFAVWRYIPAIRWGIVVKVDRSEAFGPVEQLSRLFTWITSVTVLLVLALAFTQARRLALPILALRQATQRIADGDFNVDIEVRSRNEIAELADTFRMMAHRLNENFEDLRRTTAEREQAAREAIEAKAKLQEANATLEQNVKARTFELSQRNTELELTLERLRTTQEQLVVREKMASLGEMVAGVAHEISNPLNFVNNFSDLSADAVGELRELADSIRPSLTKEQNEEFLEIVVLIESNMERIREHGARANEIVRAMLEMTRGGGADRRDSDLNALVRDYARAAYQSYRSREAAHYEATVQFDFDESIPRISVFPNGISRAIGNLMSNALWAVARKRDAMGESYQPIIRISTQQIGNEIHLRVRDNGIGIPSDHLAKVFQPFFTTRPTGSGSTGLGLSMTWEIITNQHRGRLEVSSVAGEYTEFLIVLPMIMTVATEQLA